MQTKLSLALKVNHEVTDSKHVYTNGIHNTHLETDGEG